MMAEKNIWLVYVALAGLSWGTYVPLIFYGGSELGGKPASRIMAILCVGLAYFLIAVVLPLVLFFSGQFQWSDVKMSNTGLTFSSLAGAAGAVGALCVIFATKSAVAASKGSDINFKLFIAPLIFGLAPVINTLVATIWHPQPGNPWHFGFKSPDWKLWVGIVLVGVGAALVLFAKEESESKAGPRKETAAAAAASDRG
jgi:hypothetical protein